MTNDIKRELHNKSQAIRGLVRVLRYDADYICADADDLDLLGLSISITEVKETIQTLIDNVMELEYAVYRSRQDKT